MKKVLFTATVDSHILHFHLPFLKLFKENGYEVHVATNGNEKIPYCDVKHYISFERSPFKIKNLKAILQLRKICNKEKFDIIHTHTPMGSVVTRLAARYSRRKYHTRVIYTAHGFHFFKGSSVLSWLIFYNVEKFLSKYTDTLITINNEDYELAKKKFIKCKDINYIPGVGIDKEKFNFKLNNLDKEKLKKSLNLKDNDFILTYIARLDTNKNQGFLIDAMKELVVKYPNIHLLLVGPDENNGLYYDQAKDILSNVHFLGYRNDIPHILNITDISVSSSLREGLPVNILEAMASGIPVVATDARGVRDLIQNGENGYIVSNNKKEFIDKIIELYSNEELRKNMTTNNIKKINTYYLNSILSKMSNIYFKKKTILHLLASNKYSGAENVACTIIEVLSDKYNMIYCCPNGDINNILNEKKVKYKNIKKLSYLELRKIVKESKPDIIHAHDFKASFYAGLFCNRTKVISHLHKNDPKMKKISIKSILFLYISKKMYRIVGVSKSILDEYIFKKNISNKYITLYNFVNKNKIAELSNAYKVNKKYDYFYLGRLSEEKNPIEFIEIIKMIQLQRKVEAIMIGDGPLKAKCLDLIKSYKLNIDLVGFRSNPYPYIKASRIGIMPSIFEGFGLASLEAISLGKPVFNSGVGGLKEIFEDSDYFVCKSLDEYVKKISSYSTKKVINVSNKYFDLDAYIKILNNIYEGENL